MSEGSVNRSENKDYKNTAPCLQRGLRDTATKLCKMSGRECAEWKTRSDTLKVEYRANNQSVSDHLRSAQVDIDCHLLSHSSPQYVYRKNRADNDAMFHERTCTTRCFASCVLFKILVLRPNCKTIKD